MAPGSVWGSTERELFQGSRRLEKEMVQDQGVRNMASEAWLVWGEMGKIRLRSADEMVTSQAQRGRGQKALANPNESLQSPAGRAGGIRDVLGAALCPLAVSPLTTISRISQFLMPSFLICSETAWPGASHRTPAPGGSALAVGLPQRPGALRDVVGAWQGVWGKGSCPTGCGDQHTEVNAVLACSTGTALCRD